MIQKPQQIRKLYSPDAKKPMHLVLFGSGSGTNIETLLKLQQQNPKLFQIKALVTDRKCRLIEIGRQYQIPVIYFSLQNYLNDNGGDSLENRIEYEKELAKKLDALDFEIDLIFLAGYMRLLHRPLLEKYPNQIINIHPGDLKAVNEFGERCYIGAHAIEKALVDGESRTRSSVHLVNEGMDTGPILVLGPWVKHCGEELEDYLVKQKEQSDWPASTLAIKWIAEGKFEIDQHQNLYLNREKCLGYEMKQEELYLGG